MAAIAAARVDLALVNGDLAWDAGLPQDYAHLQAALAPLAAHLPTCLTLGNHDQRTAFLDAFAQSADAAIAKVVTIVEQGPVRLILLDSLFRTDIVGGLLGYEQRHWLQRVLTTRDDRTTLLAVHHSIGESDERLLDSDRLLRIVEPFSHVKAIITAHDHAYRIESCGKLKLICLPAIGMAFDISEPTGWLEATLSATQCVLKFHAIANLRDQDETTTTLNWG